MTRPRFGAGQAGDLDGDEQGTVVSPVLGEPATVPHQTCSSCGEPIAARWRFCRACGAPAARTRVTAGTHALARIASSGRAERPVALRDGRTVLGRVSGDLVFPDDATLSSRHAALIVAGVSCEILDLGSTNGTFVSIRAEEDLEPGDVLLVGSHRLLYRHGRRGPELVEMLSGGREGRHLRLKAARALIGKDHGADMAFPEDDHVSRRHAEVARTRHGHSVRDLGSTNRTYLIVRRKRRLLDGDRVAAGSQVFEYRHLD